jgi:hypothetical protein
VPVSDIGEVNDLLSLLFPTPAARSIKTHACA